MDIETLMTQQGMRDFTNEQRDTFTNDATQIRQIAQIVQARLANSEIEGDNSAGQARRRARKFGRRLSKVARLLEKAAAETEATNAAYVRDVLELPARRQAELERKEQRKQRLGIASGLNTAVTASLTKTATAFTPQAGNQQVTAGPPPITYTNPTPYNYGASRAAAQPLPDISEIFPNMSETG